MDAKIDTKEALKFLAEGKSLDIYEVIVSSKLDAVDALLLRKEGVNIEDHWITYEDADLVYDEDIDEGT